MIRNHTLRAVVICASLFFNLTLLASAQESECIDMPNKFKPDDDTYAGNKQYCLYFAKNNYCDDAKVLEKCCSSCTESDVSDPDTCFDVTGKFKPKDENYTGGKNNCKYYRNNNYCDDPKVKVKCCVSCPSSTDAPTGSPKNVCINTTKKGFKVNGLKKKCGYWAKNNLCSNNKVKKKCCASCAKSYNSPTPMPTENPTAKPTETPTESPTEAPTESPTEAPTESPTEAPTESPTAVPSEQPSSSPTVPQCILTGMIQFPETEGNVKGYSGSSLRVTKKKKAEICGYDITNTTWGCVHEGKAKYGNWPTDKEYFSNTESATIEDAKGSYTFKMQHTFDDYSLYYPQDHKIVGNLVILLNGNTIGSFKPEKNGEDTHVGGYVNAAYKGVVLADVKCKGVCDCTVKKKIPTCPIRAEIRYPSLKVAGTKGIKGYHEEEISVRNVGDTKVETCSRSSPLLKWCDHEGEGSFYYFPADANSWDDSTTESVSITDAKNGKYELKMTHIFHPYEKYYQADHLIVPEVYVWANGKLLDTFSQDANANQDTHLADGEINPEFDDSYYIDVDCDEDCDCRVTMVQDKICEISVNLMFPTEVNANYYGYHNDYLRVEKIGFEDEICDWEYYEYYGAYETDWGCSSTGDAEICRFWENGELIYTNEEENSVIRDGANGKFRISLEHYPNSWELSNSTNDHMMRSDMTISVSGHEPQIFNHPVTDIDTHLPNNDVNPEYKGTTYVDMQCSSDCECTLTEHVPHCEIEAKLVFPEFKETYYGYHSDNLSVQKSGDTEKCGHDNKMTQWGCIHRGDGFILDWTDDKFEDYNKEESVVIPDVSDGETYTFTVQHKYGDLYDTYYKDDDKHVGRVTITVNGVVLNEFFHPKNKDEQTYNPDGTINENYLGTKSKALTCDADCNCDIKQVVLE